MQGEFLNVWLETRVEIWDRLALVDGAPNDLYCELFRASSVALKRPEEQQDYAVWQVKYEETLGNPELSKSAFHELSVVDFKGERAICKFMEDAYEFLDDLDGDVLTIPYIELLTEFISKYNLRYQVLSPCKIIPTLGGIFSSLVQDLDVYARDDEHLSDLLTSFQRSIQDLHAGASEERIKTCIQRQMNLLEGIAKKAPGVTKGDLSGMCGQLSSWPHSNVRSAISNLYTFASDYPGIRHGGRQASRLRAIDARDLIALSVALTGFIPYLTDAIDPATVFWRQ